MATVSGSCFCGAVQFEITLPTKWCAHCHCTMCQRSHGAAFVTWVGCDVNSFRLTDDKALVWFASSKAAERGFCRKCGSTLFFRSSRWPGEIHVVRTNIDGELDRDPDAHVYWETHAEWFEFLDETKKVESKQ